MIGSSSVAMRFGDTAIGSPDTGQGRAEQWRSRDQLWRECG
jgi:hypothetical protein